MRLTVVVKSFCQNSVLKDSQHFSPFAGLKYFVILHFNGILAKL